MDRDQKQCTACREMILKGALVCPKCRSPQEPQRWGTFFSVLKWIGGFTAIISLIIGVKQISGIVQEWQERDEAVNQIVTASRMLVDMKDYRAAWEIVQKATTIAPSSQKAFDQQVDVAMAWLRDLWVQKGAKTYSEIIDPLILTLSQGAGDKNPRRSAEVLAHIGWANYWREKDRKAEYEIDGYFVRALELNSDDAYANLFRGYWLLQKYGKNENQKRNLSDALAHFSRAHTSDVNPYFVNEWVVRALTQSSTAGADVEAIKIANNWRKQNNVPLDTAEKESVLYQILDEFDATFRGQLSGGSLLPRLIAALSVLDIRDTYLWLFNQIEDKRSHWDLAKKFHLGLMSEAEGKLNSAYANYIELLDEVRGSVSGYRKQARIALHRVMLNCKDNKETACEDLIPGTIANTIFLNGQPLLGIQLEHSGMHLKKVFDGPAKQGGLLPGDIFLMIDDDPLLDSEQLENPKKETISGTRTSFDLLILRERNILKYRIKNTEG